MICRAVRFSAQYKEKPRREARAQVSEASKKRSVLCYDRGLAPRIAAEAVIEPDLHDVDVLIDRDRRRTASRAGTRDRIIVFAEVDEIVFDFRRPVAAECVLIARADRPARRGRVGLAERAKG